MHFKDRSGRWQRIDSRLRRVGDRLINRGNSYSVALPAELGRTPVRVRRGALWTQFSLRGAEGIAQPRGVEAWYENALPGVDVSYVAQASSVKETLILAGPSARRSFVFDLAASRGLRPRVVKNRGLVWRDRRGRTRMSFAAPFMVDAAGKRSVRVPLRLQNVGGRWRLTMTASSRWLDSSSRKWPVKVDPYIFTEPDQDCELDQGTPTVSECGSNALGVGRSTHGGTATAHDHRTVLRFPALSTIPRDVDINWAVVALKPKTVESSSVVNFEAKPLTQPWDGQSTWNHAGADQRWHEPGGEADPSGEKAEEDAEVSPAETEVAWPVRKMVRDWITGRRPNHGLVISGPSNQFAEFYPADGNAGTQGSTEPRLEIEYTPRVGERRGWSFESMQLSDRISLKVNVASGNLLVRQTDFSMPGGLGPAIAVGRSYNSLSDTVGRLGPRWTLDTGQDVNLEDWGSSRIFTRPSGVRAAFERKADGTGFNAPAGFDMKLTEDTGGEHTITQNQSQTKEHYDAAGQRRWIEDRNGRRLSFDYATSGESKVTAIKNHAGETKASFTYNTSQKLSQVSDAAGRVYGYTYSSTTGKLESYADPENGTANPTRYENNGPDLMLSKITTPGGRITLIDYYPDGHPHARKVKSITRVTDTTAMTGPTTQFDYNALRRDGSGETEVTDPNGSATIDANDRITRQIFDDQGRVTKTIDALGRETSRKLTSTSNVESYTAASNNGTTPNSTAWFDGDDNQTRSDTPAGSGSMRDCADFGSSDAPFDPANPNDQSKACDSAPSGYAGVPSTVSGYQYLPGRATNSQGGRTRYSYTAQGNPSLVEQTHLSGNTLAAGVSMSYGNGSDTLPGRLNSVTDHRGNTTTYGYTDGKGNVNTITPPNPGTTNPTGVTTLEYTTTIARINRVIMPNETTATRQRRNLVYDNLDRLTRINFTGTDDTLDSGEPYVLMTYDRDGNQTGEETREQGTNTLRNRSMTYDKLNRVTFESLPGGASNTYTYDLVGNLKSLTDGGGKTEYTYDATNQQRAVYEPGVARPTKFEYTKDGQRLTTAYPNGVTIDNKYEDGSLRLREIHAKNPAAATLQKFNYLYNDPSTNRETPLVFEKTDGPKGQTTRYTYDTLDRLRTATIKSSAGDWTTNTTLALYDYTLDGVGNITSRVVSGSQAPASTTGYTYNSANQLCQRQSGAPAVSCPATSPPYTYDRNGNQLTAPGRTMAFNLLDQTTSINASSLIYLGAGQDRWITEGTGSFQHNVLGVGKRTDATSTDYFTRDEGGRLVSRRNGSTRHYYLHDALGSVTGITDSNGAVSQRYDYEPYGTPAPSAVGQWGSGSTDVPQGQFGFASGYRSGSSLYHYGQRFYDPVDMRWTQPDPLNQIGDLREGNRYVYAGSDPVGMKDVGGRAIWDDAQEGLETAKNTVSGALSSANDGFDDGALIGGKIGAVTGCAAGAILDGSTQDCIKRGARGAGVGGVVGGAAGAAVGAAKGAYKGYTESKRRQCREDPSDCW